MRKLPSVFIEHLLEFFVVRHEMPTRQKREQQAERTETHGRMHESGILGGTLHGSGDIERAAWGSDDDTAQSHFHRNEENRVALHFVARHAALQIATTRNRRTTEPLRTLHTSTIVGHKPLIAIGDDARPGQRLVRTHIRNNKMLLRPQRQRSRQT